VETQLPEKIAAIRRFNRLYTKRIGLLNQGLLQSKYPLIQVRILFELAHQEQTTARDLIRELDIEAGYLSRILSSFEQDGLLQRLISKSDHRQRLLRLTSKGKKVFASLDARASHEVKTLLQSLALEDQNRLLCAMQALENILGFHPSVAPVAYVLRPHVPGDAGWIIHRHGVLYANEYGFDETFEALVADILARFIQHHDPKRERLWIAEQDGERMGSVLLVDAGEQVAQLRLLLVEPKARGKGIGKRLIDECIAFSKRNGYEKLKLWTQSILAEARSLYTKASFTIVEKKANHSFGQDLISETWELPLQN
jgi:DNA-binding MarR family transcriptional regulator/GNAT superfamily N-acetyltransferase